MFREVVRVMDGGQIGDAFLGFFAVLCLDYLNAKSRCDGIEKVYQAIAMILSEPARAVMGMQRTFDDEKPMRNGAKRLEFTEKARAIVGRIRDNGIEFLRAPAFDAEDVGRFRDGVVTRRQGLLAGSGDPDEAFEFVGLGFVHIDQDMNGRDHDFGMTEARDVQHRLRSAQLLARACGWLRARWRSRSRRRRRC